MCLARSGNFIGAWEGSMDFNHKQYLISIIILEAHDDKISGIILGFRPANERRRYEETPSFIGWGKPTTTPEIGE